MAFSDRLTLLQLYFIMNGMVTDNEIFTGKKIPDLVRALCKYKLHRQQTWQDHYPGNEIAYVHFFISSSLP